MLPILAHVFVGLTVSLDLLGPFPSLSWAYWSGFGLLVLVELILGGVPALVLLPSCLVVISTRGAIVLIIVVAIVPVRSVILVLVALVMVLRVLVCSLTSLVLLVLVSLVVVLWVSHLVVVSTILLEPLVPVQVLRALGSPSIRV